jgi:hypothetical protein
MTTKREQARARAREALEVWEEAQEKALEAWAAWKKLQEEE